MTPPALPAPIIVTALIGERDFARLDALRRAHFPVERNHLRAHLTLFHHLPPSCEDELLCVLHDLARASAPMARLAGPINLGRGVAFRIDSADLAEIRAQIADRFAATLTPQDRAPWRAHVTVQNKVDPRVARALLIELQNDFTPAPLALRGLAAWRYRGGPWEPIVGFAFPSVHKISLYR